MKGYMTGAEGSEMIKVCVHWKVWPPALSVLGKSSADLRKEGFLEGSEYESYQVWERVCGLREMMDKKCSTCPHVRTLGKDHLGPFLVTPDGRTRTRLTDVGSLEVRLRAPAHKVLAESLRPRGTPGSGANAAWTEDQES